MAESEIEPLVPQRVENAIKERLNKRAKEHCKDFIEAYVKYFMIDLSFLFISSRILMACILA